MSRRHSAKQRVIQRDPLYKSVLFSKFINVLMSRGKKTVAEKVFYGAVDILNRHQEDGVAMVEKAVSNVRPSMELRSRRVGGATYSVPVPVSPRKAQALALRWIIRAAKERAERTMSEKLANELLSALNETGASVKKRIDTHKMAESNKAFAHYRW